MARKGRSRQPSVKTEGVRRELGGKSFLGPITHSPVGGGLRRVLATWVL